MNNMNQMNGFNPQPNNDNEFVLNFQPNDILQKEFKTKMRGYDPTEVDQFLDGIIKDYEAYSNELNRIQSENENLKNQLGSKGQRPQQAQPMKNRAVGPRPQMKNQQKSASAIAAEAESSTNFDILKRISNLENRVFGHDFSNGLPEENGHDANVKQFASAAVPNNMNGVESGHNEINPRMNQQNADHGTQQPQMNNQQGFNDQNHFQSNRQGQNMNGFNGNINNNGNFNQY
ncbi:cell division regulator GpsB [Companilactobacillus allii]|uniref:Cell division protein DivIVA n=1 Tax=Companilactobacillus allii TaxID=1847728 RepID=A0A1P8Q4N1_9LACO|nr:cell division regulator GpsB [Companilactobacillus allii]APX72818.1 hypothetical protein BTM29_09755 [Companilactobacillus allii]USQ67604.1 cell division regulator GpsB [Companilactobacillus allii]